MVSFVLVLWLTPGCCRAGLNLLFPADIWEKNYVVESIKCSKYKWRDANE